MTTDNTGPARGDDHAAAIRELTDRVGDRAIDLASSAYWPEQTVDEMILDPLNEVDHHAEALAKQLAEAEARVSRLRRWAFLEDQLSTSVIDLLTDEQMARPDYPGELDRQASIAHKACWAAGDIDDAPGDDGAPE